MTEGSKEGVCQTCGAELHDRFCGRCGEKTLKEDDLSLKHYFNDLLRAFTYGEGKLRKSIAALVLRPGELSKAYMNGRRVPYMRPVALFFMANLIYFLLPIISTFNTSFKNQVRHQQYSGSASQMVDRHLARTNTTREAFAVRYDQASTANAKLLLVLMVFFSAPLISLIYLGKQTYLSGYVTMAFEWMTFHLLLSTILLGVLLYGTVYLLAVMGWGSGSFEDDGLLGLIVFGSNTYCCIHMGRRYMRCTLAGSIWRALLMLFTFQIALVAYRYVLFLITFWQVTK